MHAVKQELQLLACTTVPVLEPVCDTLYQLQVQTRLTVQVLVLRLVGQISIVVWGSVKFLNLLQWLGQCELQHELQCKARQEYLIVMSMLVLAEGWQYLLQSP